MKIFYAVQATGNGHISRAMEILPHLQQYGEVDIFLSGSNSNLQMNNIKYRSKGLSLFYSGSGGLNYKKIAASLAPMRVVKEVRQLPVEKYDLVLNDYESITSLACAHKKIKSIHFGHQASFLSGNTPRPERKNLFGEFLLNNFAKAPKNIGLHFAAYDDFILPPVIKEAIWNAQPFSGTHITVYLLSYTDEVVLKHLSPLTNYTFEVFSKEVKTITLRGNVSFIPLNNAAFNKSLIDCCGIITGAGFETPAEALYLHKKLMVIPVKGQYEQKCNAAALKKFGVSVVTDLDINFHMSFSKWITDNAQLPVHYKKNTKEIVKNMMEMVSG